MFPNSYMIICTEALDSMPYLSSSLLHRQIRMQSAHIMKPAMLSVGTVVKHTGREQQKTAKIS